VKQAVVALEWMTKLIWQGISTLVLNGMSASSINNIMTTRMVVVVVVIVMGVASHPLIPNKLTPIALSILVPKACYAMIGHHNTVSTTSIPLLRSNQCATAYVRKHEKGILMI